MGSVDEFEDTGGEEIRVGFQHGGAGDGQLLPDKQPHGPGTNLYRLDEVEGWNCNAMSATAWGEETRGNIK